MSEFLWKNILLITILVLVILVIVLIATTTLRIPQQSSSLTPVL